MLIYRGNGEASILNLAEMVKEKGMEKVSQALDKLFHKLTGLSLSFSVRNLKVEQDSEVADWRYLLAEIELSVAPGLFLLLDDFLIRFTYSFLTPRQATKLLVIFHNV